jgi:hypothetical protein
LPYRPSGLEWPTTLTGSPTFFLAQFNFSDSLDLVGRIPADLLLVSADNSGGPFDPVIFEWHDLGIANLVRREDVPYHSFSFSPSYGHVFRTMSYPNAVWLTSAKYPMCRGTPIWSKYLLPQYQATQIGRAPYLIQEEDAELEGNVLCTITSVGPDTHRPYSFINRAEPLMHEDDWSSTGHLTICDAGSIYISFDDQGALHYAESCY